MAIVSSRCRVSGANVTCITDLEGVVSKVICPEYREANGVCRLKSAAASGGPLSRLLARVAEHSLDSRSRRCDFR